MKMIALGCLGVTVTAGSWAQSVDAPAVKAGDTWTYRVTTERGTSSWNETHDEVTVSRVTPSLIYYTSKHSGSTQPAIESFAGLVGPASATSTAWKRSSTGPWHSL